jgi:hypothetical protein
LAGAEVRCKFPPYVRNFAPSRPADGCRDVRHPPFCVVRWRQPSVRFRPLAGHGVKAVSVSRCLSSWRRIARQPRTTPSCDRRHAGPAGAAFQRS